MNAALRETQQPWRRLVRRVVEEVGACTDSVVAAVPVSKAQALTFTPFQVDIDMGGVVVVASVAPSGSSKFVVGEQEFPFGVELGGLRRAAQALQLEVFSIPIAPEEVSSTVDYIVDALVTAAGRYRADVLRENPQAKTHDERVEVFRYAPAHQVRIPLRIGQDVGAGLIEVLASVILDHERDSTMCLVQRNATRPLGEVVRYPYYWGMATRAAKKIELQVPGVIGRLSPAAASTH